MMNRSIKILSLGLFLYGTIVGGAMALDGSSDDSGKRELEKQVRAMIVSEIETQELKVKSIEAELTLAKKKLEQRKANLDAIVAAQVTSMLEKKVLPKNDDNLTSESAEELGGIAWQLWQQQKYDEALPKFKKAVLLNPKNANLWNGLGWTQFNLGDWKNAGDTFKRALAIEPGHGGAQNGLGQSYLGLKKYDLAEKELLQATEVAIKTVGEKQAINNASWYGLVRVYIAKKDKQKAVQWAERLLKHNSNEPHMKQLLEEARLLPEKAQ